MRFAFAGQFQLATALVVFAALIDGLDGLIARRFNAQSQFGAELDSSPTSSTSAWRPR